MSDFLPHAEIARRYIVNADFMAEVAICILPSGDADCKNFPIVCVVKNGISIVNCAIDCVFVDVVEVWLVV